MPAKMSIQSPRNTKSLKEVEIGEQKYLNFAGKLEKIFLPRIKSGRQLMSRVSVIASAEIVGLMCLAACAPEGEELGRESKKGKNQEFWPASE